MKKKKTPQRGKGGVIHHEHLKKKKKKSPRTYPHTGREEKRVPRPSLEGGGGPLSGKDWKPWEILKEGTA